MNKMKMKMNKMKMNTMNKMKMNKMKMNKMNKMIYSDLNHRLILKNNNIIIIS